MKEQVRAKVEEMDRESEVILDTSFEKNDKLFISPRNGTVAAIGSEAQLKGRSIGLRDQLQALNTEFGRRQDEILDGSLKGQSN